MDISLVIPAFNEDESLDELSAWIHRVMQENRFSYEVIFVDDGSTDRTWAEIERLNAANPHIKGIRFRRNYGKSPALNVGFDAAGGDVVITMDADLQDSPDEIPALYNMITKEGYDLVSGWKKKRYDPISKTIPTRLFNWATRCMSGLKLHDFNCGLKAYRKDVVKGIEVYGEMHRYIPVIAKWAGFRNITEKAVEHRPRKYGHTKFGIERFVNGFLDLLTIFFVSKFSKKPMHFFGVMGTLCFLTGFFFTAFLIYEKIRQVTHNIAGRDIVDKPSFYIALVLLVVGVQLFLAGFLGEMLARNANDRNQYAVTNRKGFDRA